MKKEFSKQESNELYEIFIKNFLEKFEDKKKRKKVLVGISISIFLLVLMFILKLNVFVQLIQNSETLASYNHEIFQKAAYIHKDQAVFTNGNFDKPAYVSQELEQVTLLSDSLKDDKAFRYPYLIKTKNNVVGRTGYVKYKYIPHFEIKEKITNSGLYNIENIIKGISSAFLFWEKDFRHLRAYTYLVISDPTMIYFYIQTFLLLIFIVLFGKQVIYNSYGMYDNNGRNQFFKLYSAGIGLGIVLGLFSSFTKTDSSIFWTRGLFIILPPNGMNFQTFSIYLVYFIFIISLIYLLINLSEIPRKKWYHIIFFITTFFVSISFGIKIYFLTKFLLSLLLGFIWKSIGGWSSFIEIMIVLGFVIGLFSPSRRKPKTKEEIKAEYDKINKETRRRAAIDAENIGIAAWNNGNPNNKRAYKS